MRREPINAGAVVAWWGGLCGAVLLSLGLELIRFSDRPELTQAQWFWEHPMAHGAMLGCMAMAFLGACVDSRVMMRWRT